MTSGAQNKKKARRSSKKKGYYTQQYYRTASNKVRRLKKRVSFDPQAEEQIKRISAASVRTKA